MDDIKTILGYFIFFHLAFLGLYGVIFKDFDFAVNLTNLLAKNYKGKKAIRWGLIFFVGFMLFPLMDGISIIINSSNQTIDILIYISIIFIALLTSCLNRRLLKTPAVRKWISIKK